jgi:TolB-like protein
MSTPSKAIFLSYASQDAEAARRIADALRGAGVEVWFDADGGLEHGDEWDAKIRRQVKECVLFIPLISANTQAREEGYFRIEWELAAQRALGIASGVAFILPVVIDDTREPEALVPDRFRTVQWTRLPGGAVPPEVQARFLKLWSHRTGVLKHQAARAGEAPDASGEPSPRETAGRRRGKTSALAAAAVLVLAAAWWQFRGAAAPDPGATEKPAAPAQAGNESDRLVRQARELIYDPDSARNEFALAESLLKRATELAPSSGEAWGASALLNHYQYSRAYDRDRQRLTRSVAEAEKALRLSPRNADALLAMGLHRQLHGERGRAKDFLDQAHAADPQNGKVILAQNLLTPDWLERAHLNLAAAAQVAHPAELYYYAANDFTFTGHWEEARAANARAIAAQPFWRTFVQMAVIEYNTSADPAKMDAWLDRVGELKRDEPRVAFMRYLAAALRRDGAAAVRVLNALSADYLEDNFFAGPKSYLLAGAYELAGQPVLAQEQWQLAEKVLREKAAANPSDRFFRPMLAVLLAARHQVEEARQVAAACAADPRIMNYWIAREILAEAHVRLGEPDRAIALISGPRRTTEDWGYVSAATLAADPTWDALRSRPGYAGLLEELRRAENGGIGGPPPAGPEEKSVAVLAFANLSDDKENEYFSDDISEELLTVLQKIPGLKVSARTSAFSFKGAKATATEIGQKLGVAYLVEGSVRIAARLSRAATGEQVWSESYTRDLKDVFAVQSELAQTIVGQLRGQLGPGAAGAEIQAQVQAAEKGGTRDLEAHRLYLQANYLLNDFSAANVRKGIALLEQAVSLDPGYALAWARPAPCSRATATRRARSRKATTWPGGPWTAPWRWNPTSPSRRPPGWRCRSATSSTGRARRNRCAGRWSSRPPTPSCSSRSGRPTTPSGAWRRPSRSPGDPWSWTRSTPGCG